MDFSFLFLLIAVILATIAAFQPTAGRVSLLPLAVASFALSFIV